MKIIAILSLAMAFTAAGAAGAGNPSELACADQVGGGFNEHFPHITKICYVAKNHGKRPTHLVAELTDSSRCAPTATDDRSCDKSAGKATFRIISAKKMRIERLKGVTRVVAQLRVKDLKTGRIYSLTQTKDEHRITSLAGKILTQELEATHFRAKKAIGQAPAKAALPPPDAEPETGSAE